MSVPEEDIANARRIVACVNACAGIPTDDLEKAKNSGLIKTVRAKVAAEKQRDDLLAATQLLRNVIIKKNRAGADWGSLFSDVMVALSKASEAIASVDPDAAQFNDGNDPYASVKESA